MKSHKKSLLKAQWMLFETALRLCEIGLSLAVLQRGAEHLPGRGRLLFAGQMALALALLSGLGGVVTLLGLLGLMIGQLVRYQGPYNGGADKMALLMATCLSAAHLAPDQIWSELALSYLAVQLLLSYAVSGWVKLRNPDWRSGRALCDVFAVSAYPATEQFRGLAAHHSLMRLGSWGVIGLEVAMPLAFLWAPALAVALGLAALFHLANAVLLGLNRFLWIWIAAYPALWWLQGRIIG